jgi:ribonuclease HIII
MDPNNEQDAFEKSEQNFVPFFQKGDVSVAKKPRKTQTLLEKCYTEDPDIFEIGVDEVGRGPLFGRVYSAAVILPKDDSFDHSKM